MAGEYQSLDFTDTFLQNFASKDLTAADRSAVLESLRLLDHDERHPSLRVHKLEGDREGSSAASANMVLRVTFERVGSDCKRLLTCSKHYDR